MPSMSESPLEIDGDWVRIDAMSFGRDRSAAEALEDVRAALATGARRLNVMNALLRNQQGDWYTTVEPWCDALGELGAPGLEAFVIDTYYEPLTRQASTRCGDLTKVLERCPSLQLLYVAGSCTITKASHESLRDLTLIGDPTTIETIGAVLRGDLPRLSRLAIGFSYEQVEAPGATDAFLAALADASLPNLSALHLGETSDPVRLFEGVLRSKLFPRLKSLSLSAPSLFDDEEEGLALLRDHREALAKLERVYLPTEEIMSMTDADLAALVPGLRGLDDEGANAFGPDVYRTTDD